MFEACVSRPPFRRNGRLHAPCSRDHAGQEPSATPVLASDTDVSQLSRRFEMSCMSTGALLNTLPFPISIAIPSQTSIYSTINCFLWPVQCCVDVVAAPAGGSHRQPLSGR